MGTRGSLLEDFAPHRETQRNADNRVWTFGRQGTERLKECRLDIGSIPAQQALPGVQIKSISSNGLHVFSHTESQLACATV